MSDLLVLPSQFEAFGIVFLEAWACGTAVMGTGEGAVPGVIGNEGFISEYGNSQDLASKLLEALSDTDKLKSMGVAGRSKVLRKYTWEAVGREVEKVVNQSGFIKKKVMICCNAYPPKFIGGAELIAHRHAKVLKNMGYEVIAFAGELDPERARYSIRKDAYEGITVYRVCLHHIDNDTTHFYFTHREIEKAFDDLLQEYLPDVVHFHNIVGLSVGLVQVARKMNIRTVLTLHDYWGICIRNTLLKEDYLICDESQQCNGCSSTISGLRWTGVPSRMRKDFINFQLSMIDALISPSAYLAQKYTEARSNLADIEVIPYGVDVERFQKGVKKTKSDKVRFTFVGHLGRHKGVHTILEASRSIENRSSIKINIVGDGELRPLLESEVQAYGLEETVQFRGKTEQSRIEEVLSETDVLILPSVWPENYSLSIQEAMASSIPVIASRIGGNPELVEHGVTGYLFEPGDAQDLAHCMSQFILARSKISELGEDAFRKIAEFTLQRQVLQVTQVYANHRSKRTEKIHDNTIVLCLGKEVDPECAMALNLLVKVRGNEYAFMMAEWLIEEQLSRAHLLWVVDPNVQVRAIIAGLRNKLPMLVPERSSHLLDLCRENNCGLYYQNAYEAVECIEYINRNPEVRMALGNNAFRVFYAGL